MSDSTGKEKLVMTKDQVKNKLVRKRKAQCDAKPGKKQKLTDPSVNSKDTDTIGKLVCTPILGLGDSVRTSGMIFREKCLVNGLTKCIPFNNSVLENLGFYFYFNSSGGVIKIHSSSHYMAEYEYKLLLSSTKNDKISKMSAKIGEKRRIAAYDLDSACVLYELVIIRTL